MAHLVSIPIETPPETINVEVDFYDDLERKALLASPIRELLSDLPKTIAVPTPDLCAFYLYYKMRPGIHGYSTHSDVARQWHRALVEFDGQIEFTDSSIRLSQAEGTYLGTTERLGEAVGLSVASVIHGGHQADWTRIPKASRKTLDFSSPWTASDGRRFIQVETKGSATPDNDRKTSSISQHKSDIKSKKKAATDEERRSSILYGTIAVFDDQPESVARCLLVDPPADYEGSPAQFRILTRLEYIADLITFLAARSTLAASLQTRLAALRTLKDMTPLDRVKLRKGSGTEYSPETFKTAGQHNPWFQGKSVVVDDAVGGQVFAVNSQFVILIAIQEQLVVDATEQDFAAIQAYSYTPGIASRVVQCAVPSGRFDREFGPSIEIPESRSGGYTWFSLEGNLYYCQSGLVVGVLPVPEEWQRN